MLDALDRVISAKGNRLAYLRDLFYGPQPAQTYGFACRGSTAPRSKPSARWCAPRT